MCIHETIQLSQDGEQTIYCADCGREFGHIGRDERETFVTYVTPEHPVIVLANGPQSESGMGFTVTDPSAVSVASVNSTYPCATCRWAMSCEEGCHT